MQLATLRHKHWHQPQVAQYGPLGKARPGGTSMDNQRNMKLDLKVELRPAPRTHRAGSRCLQRATMCSVCAARHDTHSLCWAPRAWQPTTYARRYAYRRARPLLANLRAHTPAWRPRIPPQTKRSDERMSPTMLPTGASYRPTRRTLPWGAAARPCTRRTPSSSRRARATRSSLASDARPWHRTPGPPRARQPPLQT